MCVFLIDNSFVNSFKVNVSGGWKIIKFIHFFPYSELVSNHEKTSQMLNENISNL